MALWETLLAATSEVQLPWLGGRTVQDGQRTWKIAGPLPEEHGWHTFTIDGSRRATWQGASFPDPSQLDARPTVRGWLVGDWLIPEDARGESEPGRLLTQGIRLRLVEPGLTRFARVRAARWTDTCWLYAGQEFPLGPEDAVTAAFQERVLSVADIPGVPPALELAFRWLTWQRDEAAAARQRAEAARREAEEARQQALREAEEAHRRALREAERLQIEEAQLAQWLIHQEEREREMAQLREAALQQTGDGALRRRLAQRDFQAAAEAALAVAGATLLDHREGVSRRERVVLFRMEGQRFECVVDAETLRVIDSGICLVDHGTGEKGDTYFTLESLPVVILQAIREGRLVIFRHAAEAARPAPAAEPNRRRNRRGR